MHLPKINSIGYGGKLLGIGLLLACALPAALEAAAMVWALPPLALWARVCFGAGALVLGALFLLLAVELRQDRRLDHFYQAHKNQKRPLAAGGCECQACGCRVVSARDACCPVCGVVFTVI